MKRPLIVESSSNSGRLNQEMICQGGMGMDKIDHVGVRTSEFKICEFRYAKKRGTVNYKVSGRVAIAIDALDEKQKKVVEGAISNKTRFITYSKARSGYEHLGESPTLRLDAGFRDACRLLAERERDRDC
jgi:hypothetical protein